MERYWSKEEWRKRLLRSVPFLLIFIGFGVYKCNKTWEPKQATSNEQKKYQRLVDYNETLNQEDMNLLAPLTWNNKISIGYQNKLMNISWDSLTNGEIDTIFRVEAIRKVFKEETSLNGIDVESSAIRSTAKRKWRKMIEAYNKYK